jgi:hypothetical protein
MSYPCVITVTRLSEFFNETLHTIRAFSHKFSAIKRDSTYKIRNMFSVFITGLEIVENVTIVWSLRFNWLNKTLMFTISDQALATVHTMIGRAFMGFGFIAVDMITPITFSAVFGDLALSVLHALRWFFMHLKTIVRLTVPQTVIAVFGLFGLFATFWRVTDVADVPTSVISSTGEPPVAKLTHIWCANKRA